ncbi:hypothetical protein [Flavobacterium sp.]|uniref:hypothetical protein n=1 Tax=Flavobacterium sp. TaxID=239 RepID=UPI0039E6D6B9
MEPKPHFLALLTYLKSEDGGRATPAVSGYRPLVKFPFHHGLFTGIQKFTDAEFAFPGDTLDAEITLLDTDYFKGKVYEGLGFDFFEGPNLIGRGIIKKMLDPEL